MEGMDLESRNYRIQDIGEEDARLAICRKEGLFIQILSFVVTFAGIFLAFWLSPSQTEIESGVKVTSVFGYPVWLMIPAALYLIQAVVMIFLAVRVFEKPSLEARITEDKEDGNRWDSH